MDSSTLTTSGQILHHMAPTGYGLSGWTLLQAVPTSVIIKDVLGIVITLITIAVQLIHLFRKKKEKEQI